MGCTSKALCIFFISFLSLFILSVSQDVGEELLLEGRYTQSLSDTYFVYLREAFAFTVAEVIALSLFPLSHF